MPASLSTLLTLLNTAPWPSSLPALQALLEQAGYQLHDTRGSHQHWKRGERMAMLCHDPALDATFLEAEVLSVPFPEDDQSYERAHQEMSVRYWDMLAEASKVLGAPRFEGPFGADDFPDSQDAVRLAAWQQGSTMCFLAFKDDGPIAPLRLVLGLELLDSQG